MLECRFSSTGHCTKVVSGSCGVCEDAYNALKGSGNDLGGGQLEIRKTNAHTATLYLNGCARRRIRKGERQKRVHGSWQYG